MAEARRVPTVAVDVNPATRQHLTGTEIFTREIAARLGPLAPEIRWRWLASRPAYGLGTDVLVTPFRRFWSQARLPWTLARERPDLLFVPAHALPLAWPGRVLTVVHDLAFVRHPEVYRARDRAYLRLTTRWACIRCPILIAISEATKSDLGKLYGVAPDRVLVVPLAAGPASVAAPASRLAELGVQGTYVLQVGRVEARKNQSTALEAVEQLAGVTLVVAGPVRDPELAARLRASSRCIVTGAVDAATLELLYRQAAAVVVPSLYEGFGLPVLEAMARGKVVVAARNSSLPEVGGEAALYYENARDPLQLAAVLGSVLADEAELARRAQAGRRRADEFSWDRTAAGVLAAIRQAL